MPTRKRVLQLSRRWHPDTWARYHLVAEDKKRILERVECISKEINSFL